MDSVKAFQFFQILRYGSLILVNIFLAKSSLSLLDIAVYEKLLFIGTAFSFFWVSGLLEGLLPSYPSLSKQDKSSFFFNVFLLFSAISLTIASFLWIAENGVTQFMSDMDTIPYYRLLCIYFLLNTPTYLIEYIFLLKKKAWSIVFYACYAFGTFIPIVSLPVLLGWGLEWSFYGLIGLALSKYLFLIVLIYRHSRFTLRLSLLKPYIFLAIPLILHILVGGSVEYIDGWIITSFFGEEDFVIFRYGAKELPLALALAGAFNSAMIPRIAENLDEALEEIKQKSKPLMHLLFGVSIPLMLFSPILFPLVFSADFKDSALIFNIYLLVLTSRLLFPQTIIVGLKKTNLLFYIALIELAINVSLSLVLAYFMGLAGVAVATVFAFAINKGIMMAYAQFKLGIAPHRYVAWRLYGLYGLLLLGSFFVVLVYG